MKNTKTREELIEGVLTRGVVNIIPSKEKAEEALKSERVLNVYLGIDPTSTKIHLGHAVALRRLQALVELGHNVKFLIGDFTALIGDTSDKESERPQLTYEQIMENFATYKDQASKFLDFERITLVHNSEWLKKLNFADVVNLMRHFSLNDFIGRELIKKRLAAGTSVSLPEVIYPVMQGYDSWFLDTDLQIGGTDQVFNMQAGRKLQKDLRNKESFIIENGFLPGTDGRKMSKTWGNGIWLSDSPEEVYGKVMSITDGVIGDYLMMGTNLPLSQVKEMLGRIASGENPVIVKRELAAVIVEELCGVDKVETAREHFEQTVVKKVATEDVVSVNIDREFIDLDDLLVLLMENGLIASKSEGRRLKEQSAIYINDEPLKTEEIKIEGETLVRVGKRRYLKLVLVK